VKKKKQKKKQCMTNALCLTALKEISFTSPETYYHISAH